MISHIASSTIYSQICLLQHRVCGILVGTTHQDLKNPKFNFCPIFPKLGIFINFTLTKKITFPEFSEVDQIAPNLTLNSAFWHSPFSSSFY